MRHIEGLNLKTKESTVFTTQKELIDKGFNPNTVGKVLRGEVLYHKGFTFTYKKEQNERV